MSRRIITAGMDVHKESITLAARRGFIYRDGENWTHCPAMVRCRS